MEQQQSLFQEVKRMLKHSVSLKLFVITVLMLLLLIPSEMIKSIIHERQNLQKQTISEVSGKWADPQTICGPILSIPMEFETIKEGETEIKTHYFHILPDELYMNGEIFPRPLERSIYEVLVYESKQNWTGEFQIQPKVFSTDVSTIKWEEAFLTIGVSDLRGIQNALSIQIADESTTIIPGSRISRIIPEGVTIPIQINPEELTIPFQFELELNGNESLNFIPLGKKTEIDITSNWKAPSFIGNFLPTYRDVQTSGFQAKWSVLEFNRNFPQYWLGNAYSQEIRQSSFGVSLDAGVGQYQKSYRSVKYAAMTIGLTFLVFFLIEMMQSIRIHPFQYILVGLALCLFYLLLVSLSEHMEFNIAYGISAISIILLTAFYTISMFKKGKLISLFTLTLSSLYTFLFITLQLSDFALLSGTIGLTLVLALTMYFTRKVNWYGIKESKQN